MSQEEGRIIKKYSLLSGEYEFHFVGNMPVEINILNISELSQGFEDAQNDDTAVYPSGIEITIDDVDSNSNNYNFFLSVLDAYNNRFPFNFESVFYLLIRKNNVNFFKGYLESFERDVKEKQITLRFTDGISKLKNTQLGDPRLLDYLFTKGIIPRNVIGPTNDSEYIRGYQYGSGANYGLEYTGGKIYIKPGKIYGTENENSEIKITNLIKELFKILDPKIEVEFDTRLAFYNFYQTYSAGFEEVIIGKILSNLIGRYVVLFKDVPGAIAGVWQPADDPDDDETQKSMKQLLRTFEKVYEDEKYITYYHNWRGSDTIFNGISNPPQLQYFNQGLGPLKINDVLKTLARNFFSYYSFTSCEKVSWRHKRYVSSFKEIERVNNIAALGDNKKTDYVKVSDAYNGVENSSGYIGINATLEEMNRLEFSIPFTATDTEYDEKSRLYIMRRNISPPQKTPVFKMKDLESNDNNPNPDYIQQRIATSERNKKDAGSITYEVEAEGVDYNFCETYKFPSGQYGIPPPDIYIQPIMMEKNLQENKTIITGVRIK